MELNDPMCLRNYKKFLLRKTFVKVTKFLNIARQLGIYQILPKYSGFSLLRSVIFHRINE